MSLSCQKEKGGCILQSTNENSVPKTTDWIGTYINTFSQSPCCSFYTQLLQSSLNICSQNVFVFFKQIMKTWNEILATMKLKGCFPSTAWKPGLHSMEIQYYCTGLPCWFPISKIWSWNQSGISFFFICIKR